MSNTINLDAKRAARRAARGGEYTIVTVDAQDFRLKPEIPMAALEALEANDFTKLFDILVLPEDKPRFAGLELSFEDCFDILEPYLTQMGESSASIVSSINIGAPARPTSPATTVSTSPPSAGTQTDLHARLVSPT